MKPEPRFPNESDLGAFGRYPKELASSKSFRKGSGKGNLPSKIARTYCKACGEKGHWKAECPNKPTSNTDRANYM